MSWMTEPFSCMSVVGSYPQMPVLLMATVTCPSLSSSPFWTLSSVGVASLTHRSCFGFVKTPMLGLAALIVVPFVPFVAVILR